MESNTKFVPTEVFKHFGNKSIMKFHAQRFEQQPLENTYKEDEQYLLKTGKWIHVKIIPNHANIISIHVLNKMKTDEDDCILLKSRRTPYGNEDCLGL